MEMFILELIGKLVFLFLAVTSCLLFWSVRSDRHYLRIALLVVTCISITGITIIEIYFKGNIVYIILDIFALLVWIRNVFYEIQTMKAEQSLKEFLLSFIKRPSSMEFENHKDSVDNSDDM